MKNVFFVFATITFWSCFSFATVTFENLKDGQEVTSPLKVKMGLSGKKVRIAGEDANDTKTGHHHLIIGTGSIPAGVPIPTDDKHLHFGKAQTEATVELIPGEHLLTLQFADGAHRSYGPEWSESVKVIVKMKTR